MCVTVEIDGDGIDWLIAKPQTLDERNASNRHEIGAAISRAIAISSRNK
jgi:hypothetical protein